MSTEWSCGLAMDGNVHLSAGARRAAWSALFRSLAALVAAETPAQARIALESCQEAGLDWDRSLRTYLRQRDQRAGERTKRREIARQKRRARELGESGLRVLG